MIRGTDLRVSASLRFSETRITAIENSTSEQVLASICSRLQDFFCCAPACSRSPAAPPHNSAAISAFLPRAQSRSLPLNSPSEELRMRPCNPELRSRCSVAHIRAGGASSVVYPHVPPKSAPSSFGLHKLSYRILTAHRSAVKSLICRAARRRGPNLPLFPAGPKGTR